MKGSGYFRVVLPAAALFLVTGGRAFGQGWGMPVVISSGIRDADTPQVAIGPEGRAVAAFTEWSEIAPFTSVQQTFANVFDGSSWGTAQRIDVDNDDWESNDPRVAMDAGGNACAAFEELTSASHVYCNFWSGSAWSGAAPVDEGLGRETDWPEVAMDGSGRAMVVFRVYDTYDKIFAGYWNGSAWTSLQIISPLGAGTNADSPGIAMDDSGDAIAVWRQYGTPNRIYGRHWNGSSWNAATTIDMGWGENALAPRVAMDGNGKAVVVFFNQDTAHNQRACVNWWDGSSWSGATTIDNGPGSSATGLDVALNGNGKAMATFIQYDGSKNRVWATRWGGSSWTSPTIIDDGTEWRVGLYSTPVAIDGFGRAVVTFTEYTTDGGVIGNRVWANIWDGSSWSGATTLDSGPDNWADNPQVAMDATGHAVVVFDQRDGSDRHIYANSFVFPARPASTWNYDYDGDGTSEIGIFRPSSGLWAVRGLTRAYYGSGSDRPVPGDYDGDGTTDIAVFRGSTGLWAVRGLTRAYFGGSSDTPLPRDYDGDGTSDIAVFRDASSLWAVRGQTRAYFGAAGDEPLPGDYRGYGTSEIVIFRGSTGLWAARAGDRIYFGGSGDLPVPAGYDSAPGIDPAIFRPATGLWAVHGMTRIYFGGSSDETVPADYDGDGVAGTGVFRDTSGLWAIRGLTRAYFGTAGDIPVAR